MRQKVEVLTKAQSTFKIASYVSMEDFDFINLLLAVGPYLQFFLLSASSPPLWL